jgi:hypothetical protein
MTRCAPFCVALAAVAIGCKGEHRPAPDAGIAAAAPSHSASALSPDCSEFDARKQRVPALLDEGKLDRAARVLQWAADGCPERAQEVWPQLAGAYGELGDLEALDALLAKVKQGRAAPPDVGEAVRRAMDATAGLRADGGDAAQARREARRLFVQGTLEPNHGKARDLFLEAARALPPAGPALMQAGRASLRLGDKVAAQKLFDQALTALQRSTGQRPWVGMDGPRGAIRRVDADSAGRLVMVSADHATVVLDAIGWRARFEYDQTPVDSSMSRDGTVVLFSDFKALTSCSLVEASCVTGEVGGDVVDVAVAPDGESAAAVLKNGAVAIVDAAGLQLRQTVNAPSGATTLAWAPAGDRLWVGLKSGSVAGVKPSTGAIEVTRTGHKGAIRALASHGRVLVSADAKTLRTGPADGAESEELGGLQNAEHDTVDGLVLSPDGQTLFVERDRGLELWSMADKKRVAESLQTMGGNASTPRIAVSAARYYIGNNMMSTVPWIHRYHGIEPYRPADAAALRAAEPLSDGASWGDAGAPSVQFLGAGGTLATVDDQCVTTIWDIAGGAFLRTTRKFEAFRNCRGLLLSDDGKFLFGAKDYRSVTRVEVATAAESPVVGEFERVVRRTVKGAPEEAIEAVSAGGVVLWVDKNKGVHVGRSPGPYRALGKAWAPRADDRDTRTPNPSSVLSNKGDRGAYCKAADTVVLFEVAREETREIRKPNLSGIAFGSDGALFVSSLDGSVMMLRDDKETTIVAPRGGIVYGLASVVDGKVIAGAVDRGPVYAWSAEDGSLLAALTAVGDGAMATAPDGSVELFNKIEGAVDCRFGPFVFGFELCRERLAGKGVLARALSGERMQP